MNPDELILESIPSFRRALADAIQDRELEDAGADLQYLFDTDVIIGSLFMLDELGPKMSIQSLRKFLVGALWYFGAVGPAAMLSPHRMEFDLQIELRDHKKPSPISRAMRAHSVLNAHFNEEKRKQLKDILTHKKGNQQQVIDFFINAGPIAIPILESVGVDWRRRLASLYKDTWLQLDPQGPSYSEILRIELPEIQLTTDLIYKFRLEQSHAVRASPPPEAELRQNCKIDAASLHTLAWIVRGQRAEVKPKNYVRFLTCTKSLGKASLKSKWLAQQLCAPQGDNQIHWLSGRSNSPAHFPLRDPGYFMLRASFPALAHSDTYTVPDPLYAVDLGELQKLSDDLRELLVSSPIKQLQRASKLHLGNRPLTSVLREFSTMGMVNRIWRQNADKFAGKSKAIESGPLKEWAGVFDLGSYVNTIITRDDKYWTEIKRTICEAIDNMRTWSKRTAELDAQFRNFPISQLDLPLSMPDDFSVGWWWDSVKSDFDRVTAFSNDLLSPLSPPETRIAALEQLAFEIDDPTFKAHERLALACMLHEAGADLQASKLLRAPPEPHGLSGTKLSCWLFHAYLRARQWNATAPNQLKAEAEQLVSIAKLNSPIHKLGAARVLYEYIRTLLLDKNGERRQADHDLAALLNPMIKSANSLCKTAIVDIEKMQRTDTLSYWYALMLYVWMNSEPWIPVEPAEDKRAQGFRDKIIKSAPPHRAFVSIQLEPQIQSVLDDMDKCYKNEEQWMGRQEYMTYSLEEVRNELLQPRLAKWGPDYTFLINRIEHLTREIASQTSRSEGES